MFLVKLALLLPLSVAGELVMENCKDYKVSSYCNITVPEVARTYPSESYTVEVLAIPEGQYEWPSTMITVYWQEKELIELELPGVITKDYEIKKGECYHDRWHGLFGYNLCLKWTISIKNYLEEELCYNLYSPNLRFSAYKCLTLTSTYLRAKQFFNENITPLEEMYCYSLGNNNFQCDVYKYNGYNVYVWSKLYPLGWSDYSYVGFYYGNTIYAYRYVTGKDAQDYSCYTIEDLGQICMKLREINNGNSAVICFKVTTSKMQFSGTKCFRRTKHSAYEFCALEGNIEMLRGW